MDDDAMSTFDAFFRDAPVVAKPSAVGRRSSAALAQQLEEDIGFEEDMSMMGGDDMMMEMPVTEEEAPAPAPAAPPTVLLSQSRENGNVSSAALAQKMEDELGFDEDMSMMMDDFDMMMLDPSMPLASPPSSSTAAATELRAALARLAPAALLNALREASLDGGATVTFDALRRTVLSLVATPAQPYSDPTWSAAVEALLGHLAPPEAGAAPRVFAALAAAGALFTGSSDDLCDALIDAGGDADGIPLDQMVTTLTLRQQTLERCAEFTAVPPDATLPVVVPPRKVAERAFAEAGVVSVPGCEESLPPAQFRLWFRSFVRTPKRAASLTAIRPRLQLCKLEHVLSAMEDQTSSSDAALSRAQFRLGFLQALIYPPNDVTGIEAADELFDAFDTDGSGSCDMTELISGIAAFTGDDSGELLKTIFSVFDADNNGTLSREEMETFIRSSLLVATLRAPAPAKEATSAAAAPPGKGKGKGKRRGKSTVTTVTRRLDVDRTARAVAKRAFAAADTDGSGTIDFDEFTSWYNKTMGKKTTTKKA